MRCCPSLPQEAGPPRAPCTLAAHGVWPGEGMMQDAQSLGCLSTLSLPGRGPVGALLSAEDCCSSWGPVCAPSSYPSGLGMVAAPTFAGPRAHWFPLVVLTGTALLDTPPSPIASVSSLFLARTLPAGPVSARVGKDWLPKESGYLGALLPRVCRAVPSQPLTRQSFWTVTSDQ